MLIVVMSEVINYSSFSDTDIYEKSTRVLRERLLFKD